MPPSRWRYQWGVDVPLPGGETANDVLIVIRRCLRRLRMRYLDDGD